jgi:hypothetical protein
MPTNLPLYLISATICKVSGIRSWMRSVYGTVVFHELQTLPKEIITELEQHLGGKLFWGVFVKHNFLEKAFDVYTDELARNAFEFLRIADGGEKLQLRKPAQRELDQKISDAKRTLEDYLKKLSIASESIELESLLR